MAWSRKVSVRIDGLDELREFTARLERAVEALERLSEPRSVEQMYNDAAGVLAVNGAAAGRRRGK